MHLLGISDPNPRRTISFRKRQKIRVQAVYGGADIGRQIRQLKDRPHIVVGTPGRMLDHINRHTLKLGTVETLVLDEADEMLNMGFGRYREDHQPST